MTLVVLGRYRIERAVDGGVAGSLYRGRDQESDEPVAIREIRRDAGWTARPGPLCASALAAAHRVHAPGIAALRQIEEDEGRLLVVSDWLDSEGLGEVIRWTGGRMVPPAAISFVIRVLDLLDRAHRQGLVHGALDPTTAVVPRGGALERAALVDFGLAALLADSGVGRMGEGLVPNLPYRAPEQLRDPSALGPRADIYAVGALLFHLLSGVPPFGESPPEDVRRGHLEASVPSLSERVAGLPAGLVEALNRSLAKEPGERFDSAAAFRDALARYEPEAAARRRVFEREQERERARFHDERTDQHQALREAATATSVPALPDVPREAPARAPRRWGLALGLGLALAAIGVAVWFVVS